MKNFKTGLAAVAVVAVGGFFVWFAFNLFRELLRRFIGL